MGYLISGLASNYISTVFAICVRLINSVQANLRPAVRSCLPHAFTTDLRCRPPGAKLALHSQWRRRQDTSAVVVDISTTESGCC